MQRTTNHPLLFILVFCLVPLLFVACAEDTEVEGETEPLGETDPEVIEPMPGAQGTAFASWDQDTDTYLTREEFSTGVTQSTRWNDWDANDDTYLTQEEFDAAFGTYPWYAASYWDTWDVDGDDRLSAEEWETGLFDTWDADGDERLQENDFDEGLFE